MPIYEPTSNNSFIAFSLTKLQNKIKDIIERKGNPKEIKRYCIGRLYYAKLIYDEV